MTAFRLVIAPVFIYLIVFDRISWWTTVVGLSAGASDYFDGIVARRHGTTTSGAFLDPLADKVVVLGCATTASLSRARTALTFLSSCRAVIITLREILMSIYRSRAAKSGISIPRQPLSEVEDVRPGLGDWLLRHSLDGASPQPSPS